jgi:hypothetical protein
VRYLPMVSWSVFTYYRVFLSTDDLRSTASSCLVINKNRVPFVRSLITENQCEMTITKQVLNWLQCESLVPVAHAHKYKVLSIHKSAV